MNVRNTVFPGQERFGDWQPAAHRVHHGRNELLELVVLGYLHGLHGQSVGRPPAPSPGSGRPGAAGASRCPGPRSSRPPRCGTWSWGERYVGRSRRRVYTPEAGVVGAVGDVEYARHVHGGGRLHLLEQGFQVHSPEVVVV